jgi:hypothetical protein
VQKKRPQQSAYDRANSDAKSSTIVSFLGVIAWGLFVFLTIFGWIPKQRIEVDGLLVGGLLAFMALMIAKSGMNIAVLQMEQAGDQADEQRSTDLALANAIAELTKEMHRRPDVSSSVVTFSLFGPSALTQPTPGSPSDKGGM